MILQTVQLTDAQVLALFGAPASSTPSSAECVYQQQTPATVWTIVHNLGMHPAVRVVDSSGALVEGGITYQDANTVIVSFCAGFSGTAYLS